VVEKATGEKRLAFRFKDNLVTSDHICEGLLAEYLQMINLEHPNILKAYQFFEQILGKFKMYYIVFEQIPKRRTLLQRIQETPTKFVESDVATII
jgi:hypothetical protein